MVNIGVFPVVVRYYPSSPVAWEYNFYGTKLTVYEAIVARKRAVLAGTKVHRFRPRDPTLSALLLLFFGFRRALVTSCGGCSGQTHSTAHPRVPFNLASPSPFQVHFLPPSYSSHPPSAHFLFLSPTHHFLQTSHPRTLKDLERLCQFPPSF